MQNFTAEELKKYDGKEGRPAYIAYHGKVYDVTGSKMWKEGMHMKRHEAGSDLSSFISAAPHGVSVLEKFPAVGQLVESAKTAPTPQEARLKKLQDFYAITHPHPMMVHFPMALVPFALLMNILQLLGFGGTLGGHLVGHFYYAGYYAVVCAFLSIFFAAGAGIFSWWINYNRGMNIHFRLKFIFTAVLALMLLIEIALGSGGMYNIMLFMNCIPLVIIGFNGGRITWPN